VAPTLASVARSLATLRAFRGRGRSPVASRRGEARSGALGRRKRQKPRSVWERGERLASVALSDDGNVLALNDGDNIRQGERNALAIMLRIDVRGFAALVP